MTTLMIGAVFTLEELNQNRYFDRESSQFQYSKVAFNVDGAKIIFDLTWVTDGQRKRLVESGLVIKDVEEMYMICTKVGKEGVTDLNKVVNNKLLRLLTNLGFTRHVILTL